MPLYEHVYLARQDISQAQVDALTAEFKQIVEEGGGKIAKSEYWGVKALAYKIKKNRKAHYLLLNIEAPPAAVAELERRMGLSTDVLRFMTVRVEEHEVEPSIQMRKSDRDERGDRGDRGDRGGGGFRGDRGPRGGAGGGGGGGGFRGDREGGGGGGSTYRARPPREGGERPAGDRPPGDRPPRDFGDRPPRPPRPPRDPSTPSGA